MRDAIRRDEATARDAHTEPRTRAQIELTVRSWYGPIPADVLERLRVEWRAATR